ncbi:MAG: hypothetical protein ACK55O_13980 [Phycisphaerales bacterium]|jgi:hypothetical protein
MTPTAAELADELHQLIMGGGSHYDLAKWSDAARARIGYLDSSEVSDVLTTLSAMSFGEEFWLSRDQLKVLAQQLAVARMSRGHLERLDIERPGRS